MASFATFCGFLLVAAALPDAATSASSVPQEVYWSYVLPNTPVPSVLHRLMHTDVENTYRLKDALFWNDEGFILNKEQNSRINSIRKDEEVVPSPKQEDDINVADFMLHSDLHPGTNLTLHVLATRAHTGFLAREEADSMPVAFSKLPQILAHYSVQANSPEEKAIKTSMVVCDGAPANDRARCIPSLESLVEFAITGLGTFHIRARSTRAVMGSSPPTKQQYIIAHVRRMDVEKAVVCHPLTYPYALYFCHVIHEDAKPYKVLALGKDGTMIDVVVVCHMNTNRWDSKLELLLNFKGKLEAPVCHFLSKDNILWTSDAKVAGEMEDRSAAVVADA